MNEKELLMKIFYDSFDIQNIYVIQNITHKIVNGIMGIEKTFTIRYFSKQIQETREIKIDEETYNELIEILNKEYCNGVRQ